VRPYFAVAGLAAMGGLGLSLWAGFLRRSKLAFRSSCVAVAGLFACACVAVYPYGVIARVPSLSILAADGAASTYGLSVALGWWLPGMSLVVAYTFFAHRRWLVRSATDDAEGR
jgi:cytochrome bd-type quinol oxidase subunit 2